MPNEFLQQLIGDWEGSCRTWFEPGEVADESPIAGEIQSLLGGRFVRHAYSGRIQGRPRRGEETMAFNSVTKVFQLAWFDDFHMNYAIMFSQGEPTEKGFSVVGQYDVGPGDPPWRWRTVFEMPDPDRLTITAYNISPDGEPEMMAFETRYVRSLRR